VSLVLDASAACELLFAGRRSDKVAAAFREHDYDVHAPHLLDLEVLSVLRRKLAARATSEDRANDVLDDLAALPIERYPHLPLAKRIWELRPNFTPYDAAYLALAEAIGAELLTSDTGFARAARAQSDAAIRLVRG
jgi:predicted nucleic acid-binding protein